MQSAPKKDRYKSFSELQLEQKEGIDYDIEMSDRQTPVVFFAPHAGYIEPGTSEITKAIAGDDYSFYCFKGLKQGRPHNELHITSSNFDEPKGRALAQSAEIVIAIHGRGDAGDPSTIWVGGLDDGLKEELTTKFIAAGFAAISSGHKLEGKSPENICNQGSRRAGVQFELPRTLRDSLVANEELRDLFVQVVRGTLAQVV